MLSKVLVSLNGSIKSLSHALFLYSEVADLKNMVMPQKKTINRNCLKIVCQAYTVRVISYSLYYSFIHASKKIIQNLDRILPQHHRSIYYCTMFRVGSVVSSPAYAQYFVLEPLTSYRGFGSENQVMFYLFLFM